MASVTLDRVTKYYGPVCAVKDFSLTCADGQMLALLGPSGCGKTSTLKMIAGVEEITRGEIYFDGRPVGGLAPGARNIAMVFEDYALYPNMTVAGNIAFPLKIKKYSRREIARRIDPVLELLSLSDIRDSNIGHLSGGAQQRVSIGRALVREPELIIFDEPLSHLDGDQKVQLRAEIKRLQQTMGLTAILVTHDQTEAIAMADQVAVMNHGELQQVTTPQTLYDRPANLFTANFVGDPPMNLLKADVTAKRGGGVVLSGPGWELRPGKQTSKHLDRAARKTGLIIGIRPEHIELKPVTARPKTGIRGVITRREYRGDTQIVIVAAVEKNGGAGSEITVELVADKPLGVGQSVALKIPDEALNAFEATTGDNVLGEGAA